MTFSFWVKRNSLGADGDQLIGDDQTAYPSHFIVFNSSDQLDIRSQTGVSGATLRFTTNRVFRDMTSFYHIMVVIDTTQATASNRLKVYVNGVQQTSFATSTQSNGFGQNTDTHFNEGAKNELIGKYSSAYANFNLAHYYFIDGTALTPATFGETDSTTGEWKPKLSVSPTYGNQGYLLKFESAGALGTDSSGNSKTWTVNGTLKQSASTTSNLFCTLDPNQSFDKSQVRYSGTAYIGTTDAPRGAMSTLCMKKGKWYVEFKPESSNTGADRNTIGVFRANSFASIRWKYEDSNAIVGKETGGFLGNQGMSYQPMTGTPNIVSDADSGTVNYGVQASANDIIMMALDLDNGKLWFGKNGTWFNAPSTSNAGVPNTGANAGISFSTRSANGDYWGICVTASSDGANKHMYINFGEGRFGATAVSSGNADDNSVGVFEYDVPAGFFAICTKNIKTYG
jgi:hypothetical protein